LYPAKTIGRVTQDFAAADIFFALAVNRPPPRSYFLNTEIALAESQTKFYESDLQLFGKNVVPLHTVT
jgi:hypothetical protein